MSSSSPERMAAPASLDHRAIEQFIFHEARLADEHRYDEWEALWADPALYWVPIREDLDPEHHVSFIYDNRRRIATRIRQLKTGRRHAQVPASELRRVISNIEITAHDRCIEVQSNFVLNETRRGLIRTWAGRSIHRLIPDGSSFKMAEKRVLLVNRRDPIDTLAFLI